MIVLKQGDLTFNYRAAGIALHNGYVLLHRADDEDFWSLPGGRVEMLETAQATLKREMLEEINADVEVGRLLLIIENLFHYNDSRYHELGLYFDMHLPESFLDVSKEFAGVEDNNLKLIYQWFKLDALAEISIKPAALKQALLNIDNATICHIINDELAMYS